MRISNGGLSLSEMSWKDSGPVIFFTSIYDNYHYPQNNPIVLCSFLVSESSDQEEKMATITASTPTSSITRAALVHKPSTKVASPAVVGLPAMAKKGNVSCSMENKPAVEESGSNMGMGAALLAAACAATMSSPAMALVDERMSTEGTGLPFGLSNNLLGWILFGVFGLIWAFYIVYTSSLEEDEESGLSL